MRVTLGPFFIILLFFGWCSQGYAFQVEYEYDSIKMATLYARSKAQRVKNPELSLELGEEFLQLAIQSKNKAKEAVALQNLARLFFNIGNYGKALEYFFKALNIAEEKKDKPNQATMLNNIGIVYAENHQLEKALEYYNLSLELKEVLGDQKSVANTLNNIGLIYAELGNSVEAHKSYQKALKIDYRLENTSGIFATLNNIGENYYKKKAFDSALVYYKKSMEVGVSIDNEYDKAHLLNNLAAVYLSMGDVGKAESIYLDAANVAKRIKARLNLKDSYLGLSKVYDSLKIFDRSLEYYKRFEYLKDSLFNEEKLRKIGEVEADYKIKKMESELNLVKKDNEIRSLRRSQNRLITYLLISCLFLFGVLLTVLYKRNQFKIKANKKLEQKNKEILDKNMDIMDSISYAKSIQEAFLPDTRILNKFFNDSFVYYRARDVINGDFYWFSDEEDYLIFAVVDCTGHGVPGALITVMGNSLLNQVVMEQRVLYPAEILKELNYRVLNTLNQEDYQINNNEGMDIAICRFDKGSKKLSFAGAKRPLYFFKNGELQIIKGDSHSVGGTLYSKDRDYQEHEIYLDKNDTVYIFSDGYGDQFGGENNKKFLSSRFKDMLYEVQGAPMSKQNEVVDRKLRYWMNENEQTDDILIIGLQV